MDENTYRALRAAADDESISYGELADIEGAFDTIPDSFLRDLRENAMADDMLDEIAAYNGWTDDPTCDICDKPMDTVMDGTENDWNGETGAHLSCESATA